MNDRVGAEPLARSETQSQQSPCEDSNGTAVEELWNFFLETKFLYEKKLTQMDCAAVQSTLRRLGEASNAPFKAIVTRCNGQIQSHVATLRLYDRTWLIQHVAARRIPGMLGCGRATSRRVLRFCAGRPDIEWLKVCYRPENRWPAQMFGRFALRHNDPSLSDHRVYRYMVSTARVTRRMNESVTVRPALADDYPVVEAYFADRYPEVLRLGEDLTTPHFGIGQVRRAYAALGIERRRELLVAERCGQTLGFALLEVSSPGLNFSELTNTFRVFALNSDEPTRLALTAAASNRYIELGRTTIIGLATDDESTFRELGFERTREYACWTFHRSLIQGLDESLG